MTILVSCDDPMSLKALGMKVHSEDMTIVFPTDTVFGLGANPLSVKGVDKCFEIKTRDSGKPVPVLGYSKKELQQLVSLNRSSESLIERFWPGKLTIILPVREDVKVPRKILSEDRTLGVRVPNHACCRQLIDSCGGLLIGTSANESGKPPFISADDEALLELSSKADYFVNGDCGPEAGKPSTVVDATSDDKILVLREGAIRKDEIFSYLEKASKTAFSLSRGTS